MKTSTSPHDHAHHGRNHGLRHAPPHVLPHDRLPFRPADKHSYLHGFDKGKRLQTTHLRNRRGQCLYCSHALCRDWHHPLHIALLLGARRS